MPLQSPDIARPRQEVAEASHEVPKKIEGGIRIVNVVEVAARFEAGQRAEAQRAELTEQSARSDMAKAKEAAGKFNNPALISRLLAEIAPKERVAQKSAADRETATLKATEARAAGELLKIEKDQPALDAWERTREQEASALQKELKLDPDNKQARDRLAQVTVELNTVMNLPKVKQELLNWNRAQQPPRAEAPRMAAQL
ncbi:MAG: hypothetical protein AAB579_02030 [Patescibacteria group bacterium]